MTKQLQRMTPLLPLPRIKFPLFLGKIVEGRIEVGFDPTKKRKIMNTPPVRSACPARGGLHDLTMKPLPPHNSHSSASASTTTPRLSPAVIVLRLCRRLYADCCFFVIVASAIVAPPPPAVHRISSAAIALHLIRHRPPPHPTVVPSSLPLCMLRIS